LSAATNHIATYSAIQMRRALSVFNCQQQIKCRTLLPLAAKNAAKKLKPVVNFHGLKPVAFSGTIFACPLPRMTPSTG